MKHLEFSAGQSIDNAAIQLCAAAAEHGEATGKFNDIELHAAAGYAPAGVVNFYNEECQRRSEAYRNSPEGKAAARKSNNERADLQAKHDALMARLPALDWSNDAAVLDWICAMQEPSDRVGVIVRRNSIVSAFEARGFHADANCGKDYKPGDRENMFRYLVGQGLSGLKDGPAIHPIIHKFAAEWRAQFTNCLTTD
jgi:hypothetical protein